MKRIRPTTHAAFTLIELLVVVSVIMLIAAVALPSIVPLFSAGSDSQAVNLLSAQLAEVRSLAMTRGQYTCLHIQPRELDGETTNQCYAMYFELDPQTNRFQPIPGYAPIDYPGTMAVGDIEGDDSVLSGSGNYDIPDAKVDEFQSVTLVFSPTGQLVRMVNGQPPVFDESSDPAKLIWRVGGSPDERAIWAPAPTESGGASTTVVFYDLARFSALSGSDRDDYLNESGFYVAINRYTGELYPRESQEAP